MRSIIISKYSDPNTCYFLDHEYRNNRQIKLMLLKSKADDTREIEISIDNMMRLVDISGGPLFCGDQWSQRAFPDKV